MTRRRNCPTCGQRLPRPPYWTRPGELLKRWREVFEEHNGRPATLDEIEMVRPFFYKKRKPRGSS